MDSPLSTLAAYARVVRNVDRFLRDRLTPDQARTIIKQRLETREDRFLAVVEQQIFAHPRSPYLPLLRRAGCELGDLRNVVKRHGLERALEMMRDEGVYFSFEEFKGRRDVVRGNISFRPSERDFDNPLRESDLEVRTGASRSRGSPIKMTLDAIAENRAIAFSLMLEAVGASQSPLMTWLPGFPSGSGFFLWLGLARIGKPPLRWFAVTNPARSTVSSRHRLLLPAARLLARRYGLRLPAPEFTPLSASEVVLEAMLGARRRWGNCVLITTPSAAVRVASLARQRGESLEHVRFLVGSEPLTPGKAEEIRRTGAGVNSRYIFMEGGAAGIGCGNPNVPDDMHFMADSFALIQNRRVVPGIGQLDAFMFTSLLTLGPKVMLNVESDDFGDISRRHCGCPLDDLGLHRHVGAIRSFTKLTGEGATVFGTGASHLLEEVLPREFGGSSVDYQLLESEDENHLTRLFLIVSPDVGNIDEQMLLKRFNHLMWKAAIGVPEPWFQAQTIQVVRRYPIETPGGKLLPIHTQALASLIDRKSNEPHGGSHR